MALEVFSMIRTSILAAATAAACMLAGNPAGAASVVAPAQVPVAPGVPAAQISPPGPPAAFPFPVGQTIAVVGRGTVEAAPDRALVTIGAQAIRPTAQEAQERVSGTMTQVLQRVMALGIPRERIQTVEINLYPQRRPQSGDITGYQAVQRLRVTVDDLALVGRVLDAAVTAGANLLDGVSFTLRDSASYRARAFAAAAQDARATANALAAASGVTIARVVRIEEMGAAIPIMRGPMVQAAPEASTPVLPGTLSVTSQVRVIFGF
jgi:uncharacterized protein